jgi:hypothetical protein
MESDDDGVTWYENQSFSGEIDEVDSASTQPETTPCLLAIQGYTSGGVAVTEISNSIPFS